MRRSGLFSLALLLAAGCAYGFAGGGLPAHVKTIAVIPFDNETTSSEIQRELVDAFRAELHNRLGVREAPEARANAIVRGTIQRYETDIPVAYSGNNTNQTSARRQLQISVDIEMFDQVSGKVLWQRKALTAEGLYEERGVLQGRKEAIDRIVNDVIQGAQSQW